MSNVIPKNISKSDILDAIREIDDNGIPKGRDSKKFALIFNGKYYPPKYVISLANRYANAVTLSSEEFGGGGETNGFLAGLGFEIVDKTTRSILTTSPISRPRAKPIMKKHNERCPECKKRIEQLLTKLYGTVIINHKFDIYVQIQDITDPDLIDIYKSLSNYRGHTNFVRAKTLPNCDYYLPDQKMLVEFDESQHFTTSRKLTLEEYPDDIEVGYKIAKWINLCHDLDKKDNDPAYRDEQRAWYDTIRDFLPRLEGLKPTVRLFADDMEWCKLDLTNQLDLNRFKLYIEKGEMGVSTRQDSNPFFGRIIIADDWCGDIGKAEEIIQKVTDSWPEEKKVKFLITCGGFIQFAWPDLTRHEIGDNKDPNPDALKKLYGEAKKCARNFLTPALKEKLKKYTDFITLGVDSHKEKISTTQNYISHLHTEMVCLYDLRNNKEYWTGKSYPTTAQEKGLVRTLDPKSHIVDLPEHGKVCLMGCHDLSVFSPRSVNAKGWRREINDDLTEYIIQESPRIVLHHPHTADAVMTWRCQWAKMERDVPSIEKYAGAGRYYNIDGERSELNDLLRKTKRGNTIDFIININKSEMS